MGKYALTNGIILDGTENMSPLSGKTIFVSGDRIEAIKDKNTDTSGYEVVDLDGSYVMPGLINLHVHIPATGKPKKKPTDPKKLVALISSNGFFKTVGYGLCKKYVMPELWSGVTTIRTVGGALDFDTRLRDEIASGKADGPRIVASNMAISVPGGHMAGSLAYEAHSFGEAAELVRKIANEKPDLIKLMITGGVMDAEVPGEPGGLRMPPEYVKAACDEAHRLGFTVAAHVESPEGVRVALQNGVDTIEHGAKPDEEIIALFKEKGAVQISTISPALPYALFDTEISHATEVQKLNGKVVFDGIVECAKACLKNGITVGLGNDTGCPFITHYSFWRELALFVKYCEVTPAFALHTATLLNAKILKMDHEIGSLEEGKCADIIVTKENPLDNICALRNVSFVMARGKISDISHLHTYPEVEREMDKYM